jgi:hypothetical protein
MPYNFTKAIARAKKKQEQECVLNIESENKEYEKQLNNN